MMPLPILMRRLFQCVYGLITFAFVGLVAHAATYGAFFSADATVAVSAPETDSDTCNAEIQNLYNGLIEEGGRALSPNQSDRLVHWNTSTQDWLGDYDRLWKRCKTPRETRRKVKALKRLYQAYTTAIRTFHTRGRSALSELSGATSQSK